MTTETQGLFRSAAFRLSLFYLAVFAAFAGALIAYMAWSTRVILAAETRETIAAETRELAEEYAADGIQRLVEAVAKRSQGPANALYLISSFAGESITGNIAYLPLKTLKAEGYQRVPYRHTGDAADITREAELRVFRLTGGFVLVVGRDISERVAVERVLWRAGIFAVVLTLLLAVAGGVFVRMRILKPIDAMSDTARAIMGGDLSNRVPLSGSEDEFSRLGESLNAMLARIEALVRGMREVTDNVAHDLKTPLTRMKARAEDALRAIETGKGLDEGAQRQVLEDTIREADELISVFSALLAIARAEAGEGAGHDRIALGALAADAAELYEPAAEDAGVKLTAETADEVFVSANKALLARAVSNLIENAITHGRTGGGGKVSIRTARNGRFGELTVADNGPGIAEADRKRVLDRFVRLEQSRSRPGSGLGLSLANAVARLHNGELELNDNSPGLRITMRFPLAEAGGNDGGGKGLGG
ncbi:MAG: HAMP domain-containing sensor histidine kinase [Tepidamorphaceae bacterium]|nr:HAMP domain-containing histidine kinase [Rhodobiaceae bacterium]MCC0048544.1 HAMP domain-containing histidine kinase [Rhodobiaceae bacterium]